VFSGRNRFLSRLVIVEIYLLGRKGSARMIHRTVFQIVLAAALFFTASNAAFIHPFTDTTAGNVWEYRFGSGTTLLNSMGVMGTNTSRDSGIITIKILPSREITVVKKGMHYVSSYSFATMTGTSDSSSINDSSTVSSWDGIALSSIGITNNPFVIDSLFPGDPWGLTFERVTIQKDTLYEENIVINGHSDPDGDYSSSQTTAYLQKYGLVGITAYVGGNGNSSTSSFTLVSFNGKSIDLSQITTLDSISMSDMEKLYPAYASHQNSAIGCLKHPQSPSTPRFALQTITGGIRVSFSTASAYSLKLTSVSGRELFLHRGNAGEQRVFLQKTEFPAGIYVANFISGPLSQSIKLRIW
jgi:hypothetical protein